MPKITGMSLSIDLTQYLRLPAGVRLTFDGWLDAETLIDKRIIKLTLVEGAVTVEQYKQDAAGRVVTLNRQPVVETATYPVRSLPPREAFEGMS